MRFVGELSQVDECGNIWKFDFTGIWDYEGIQIPDWPDSFFRRLRSKKLNVCFADLESVAEVKDVSIDDGPELCYIREQESWALEFYVNFTVVESDGMQKDHYTKMCVLFGFVELHCNDTSKRESACLFSFARIFRVFDGLRA